MDDLFISNDYYSKVITALNCKNVLLFIKLKEVEMKLIFTALLAVLFSYGAFACDICGCSSQSTSLGLLPGEGTHFIGLRYNYRPFSGIHPPQGIDPGGQRTHDQFHTTELWGRYSPIPRLQIYGFIPYRYSIQEEEARGNDPAVRRASAGIGDVSVLISGVIFHSNDSIGSGIANHDWTVGVNIKAPTGQSREIDSNIGIVLPNMQMGTGSWDFSLVTNYRFVLNKWGLNANASYRYNLANKYRYQFGERIMGSLHAFRNVNFANGDVALIPQAGVIFEYASQDYQNTSKNEMNEYSGGYFLFGEVRADLMVKNFGFSVGAAVPLVQNYGQNYIRSDFMLTAGVKMLFKSKKVN